MASSEFNISIPQQHFVITSEVDISESNSQQGIMSLILNANNNILK